MAPWSKKGKGSPFINDPVAMREVIQKVMAGEAKAKRILESANAEADGILKEAGQQVRDIAARARTEAAQRAIMEVEAALKAAEQEKQVLLARAVAKNRVQVQLDPITLEKIVNAVVCCVSGQRIPGRE
jgi:vacuolar-type H+-ATPase subunit H